MHLSDWTLDALRTGALDDEAAAAARRHLEECADCRARAEALEQDARAFAARFDLAGLAADAMARASPPPRRRWAPLLGAVVTLAAAAVVVVFLLPTAEGPAPPTERLKGAGPSVEAWAGGTRLARPGPGDVFSLRYTRGPWHVRILWVGTDAQHDALHPAADAPSIDASAAAGHLPGSVTLDDEPGRFVAVYCDAPFDHAAAVERARGAREGCTVSVLEAGP